MLGNFMRLPVWIVDARQVYETSGVDRQAPAKADAQLFGSSPADKPAGRVKQTAAKARRLRPRQSLPQVRMIIVICDSDVRCHCPRVGIG